ERHGTPKYAANTYAIAGWVLPWSRPVRKAVDVCRRAVEVAQQAANLNSIAYALRAFIANRIAAGDPLAEVEDDVEHAMEFGRRAKLGYATYATASPLRLVQMLQGRTPEFDEEQLEAQMERAPRMAYLLFAHRVRKLQAYVFFGEFDRASAVAAQAQLHQG